MTISNTAAATLDLSTRIAWARIDVARGTATPEELLAIIEDIQTGRDEEMANLRHETDKELAELRDEPRDEEARADDLESALDTIMRLVRDAATNHRDDSFQQLWQDVKAAQPRRFR